jgi:hypothetical protein
MAQASALPIESAFTEKCFAGLGVRKKEENQAKPRSPGHELAPYLTTAKLFAMK